MKWIGKAATPTTVFVTGLIVTVGFTLSKVTELLFVRMTDVSGTVVDATLVSPGAELSLRAPAFAPAGTLTVTKPLPVMPVTVMVKSHVFVVALKSPMGDTIRLPQRGFLRPCCPRTTRKQE